MKLLRHGPKGRERPGLLDADGQVRDLGDLLAEITPATLSPGGLAALRGLDPNAVPVVPKGTLAVPWSGMRKFIAIGLNYADHAAEAGLPLPNEPVVFTKTIDCAVGCNHDVVLPKGSLKADWEVELGVVIGTRARYVSETTRSRTLPATASSTTSPSASTSSSAAASGTRARAATPSARLARGSSPPTKWATRSSLRCGSRSTATATSAATQAR